MSSAPRVEQIPEALALSGSGVLALEQLHECYLDRVSTEFADAIARADDSDPALGQELIALVHGTKPASILRVMLAPETTSRILHRRALGPSEVGRFLRLSLMVERALDGQSVEVLDGEAWSALGDACLRPGGELVMGPRVDGLVPIDLDSPYARTAPFDGESGPVHPPRPSLNGLAREQSLALLREAGRLIPKVSQEALGLISLFTKVIVVQPNPASRFSSESHGHYIGRTMLSSADWKELDTVEVADALIHEAVHDFLLIQELANPWVTDSELYDRGATVPSPWSGTLLTVDVFLHACFVWYALLHFWIRAASAGIFPAERAKERKTKAARGFRGAPLIEHVRSEDAALLSSEVRDAVSELDLRAGVLIATEF